jgi:RimJ/RimL family protein N-acetyltransferase
MEIRLSPADQNDFSLVLGLLKEAALRLQRKGLDQWQNWLEPSGEDKSWIQEGFDAKEFFLIINELNQVLGTVRVMSEDLLYWGKQEEQGLYIHSLTVSEKYAGQGIGQAVISKVKQQAYILGYGKLRLDCNSANPALCRYYENQGFSQVGVREFEDFSCNLYEVKIKL